MNSFLKCASLLSALSHFTTLSFTLTPSHTRLKHRLHESPINGDGQLENIFAFTNDDEEDEDDPPCDITARYGKAVKSIFIVSDSTGATAKSAVTKSLAQFDDCGSELRTFDGGCSARTRVFTFVRGQEAVAAIIKTAQSKNALIVFTIVDPTLREATLEMCHLLQVPVVDLLGPTLEEFATFLQKTPVGVPRPERVELSDAYFRRIQAVEFTLKADDGQSPWLLKEADIVIVGVSRTGKTPLSVVLSQTMGLKVANIPLVLECPAPSQLFEVDAGRVFCLTIAPSELKKIRQTRLARRSLKQIEAKFEFNDDHQTSNYADRAYLLKDLKRAREMAEEHDWTEIDVTGRAVEETASLIGELFNDRMEEECE